MSRLDHDHLTMGAEEHHLKAWKARLESPAEVTAFEEARWDNVWARRFRNIEGEVNYGTSPIPLFPPDTKLP
jgi:hypothetical protein